MPPRHQHGFTLTELLIVLGVSAILGAGVITSVANVGANLTARSERAAILQLSAQAATLAQATGQTTTLTRTGQILTVRAGTAPARTTFTAHRLRLSGATTIATYAPTGRATTSGAPLTATFKGTRNTLTVSMVGQALWSRP